MSFIGRVTSCKFIQGRADIAIVAARAPDKGGEFNCPMAGVTLNGKPATVDALAAFVVSYGQISATFINPDWGADGTGFIPCDSITLTALE